MRAKEQTQDRNNMNDPQKKYRLGTVSIEKAEVIQRCMEIGHIVILNAVQDIEDIQEKEYGWRLYIHCTEDWNDNSIK